MQQLAALDTYDTIGVVGLGQTGLSCVRYLLSLGLTPVVFDTRPVPAGIAELQDLDPAIEVHTGPLDAALLMEMDLLIVSPGIDTRMEAIQLAKDADIPLTGDIEIFGTLVDKPVIGITGSNGKSTVTRLTGELVRAAGRKVAVGGNIGVPVLDLIMAEDHDQVDVYVLELSSFQLDLIRQIRLTAATILNISDDHLDRYASTQEYAASKHRIYNFTDIAVWNREQRLTAPRHLPLDQQLSFGADESDDQLPGLFGLHQDNGQPAIGWNGKVLLKASELQLTGVHNLLNVQAALALVSALGIEPTEVTEAVREFRGLPHRCELVGDYQGVQWVNDSKATNIGAAEAAIKGVRELVPGKLILIAGGDGKGADFSQFRDALRQVDALITLGKDGDRIAAYYPGARKVSCLREAVAAAKDLASEGSMVLLSPACASLDMFRNYEDRGEQFRQAVEACHA